MNLPNSATPEGWRTIVGGDTLGTSQQRVGNPTGVLGFINTFPGSLPPARILRPSDASDRRTLTIVL